MSTRLIKHLTNNALLYDHHKTVISNTVKTGFINTTNLYNLLVKERFRLHKKVDVKHGKLPVMFIMLQQSLNPPKKTW